MSSRSKIYKAADNYAWSIRPGIGARPLVVFSRPESKQTIVVWFDSIGRVLRAERNFGDGLRAWIDGGVEGVIANLKIFGAS